MKIEIEFDQEQYDEICQYAKASHVSMDDLAAISIFIRDVVLEKFKLLPAQRNGKDHL